MARPSLLVPRCWAGLSDNLLVGKAEQEHLLGVPGVRPGLHLQLCTSSCPASLIKMHEHPPHARWYRDPEKPPPGSQDQGLGGKRKPLVLQAMDRNMLSSPGYRATNAVSSQGTLTTQSHWAIGHIFPGRAGSGHEEPNTERHSH